MKISLTPLVLALALSGCWSSRPAGRARQVTPVEGCRQIMEAYCINQARTCDDAPSALACFGGIKETVDCRHAVSLSSSWAQCLSDIRNAECPAFSDLWSSNCRHVVSFKERD